MLDARKAVSEMTRVLALADSPSPTSGAAWMPSRMALSARAASMSRATFEIGLTLTFDEKRCELSGFERHLDAELDRRLCRLHFLQRTHAESATYGTLPSYVGRQDERPP